MPPTTPYAGSRGRVLHDSAGDELGTTGNPLKASVASGSGGVTEYTEDAAAAANPIGGALILVRRDTLTVAEVTTDGDNVAGKATSKGELYTKDSDLAAALYTEDAASAANPAGWMLMARRRDVPVVGEVTTEGDNIAINANKFGELRVVTSQEGLQYETVAASQTSQALGATGATGDFLSHVIIQPVTTAAGTCTILDNAIVIFTFTTGTLADLRPITIPVNAFSVSGAWKCTSGANVTMTGFGRFT